MFWEGERQIAGTVEIEYWLGNRHDADLPHSGRACVRKPDPSAQQLVNHFCDPHRQLLRVEVKCGRNIINLDDDDGSDPYVEVAVEQPDGTEEKHRTHYIDRRDGPEWNTRSTSSPAKPYKSDLVLRVYDYDGATSYDDLIGVLRIPVCELPVHNGIKKCPDAHWYTLVDPRKELRQARTPRGDLEIRAYLDEEYFEHLHEATRAKPWGE